MLDYDKKFLLKSADNLTFDGSSIRGFTPQRESDLRSSSTGARSIGRRPTSSAGKVLVFGDVIDRDGSPFAADMRGILKTVLEEQFEKNGYTLNAANEIEGFVFQGLDAERTSRDRQVRVRQHRRLLSLAARRPAAHVHRYGRRSAARDGLREREGPSRGRALAVRDQLQLRRSRGGRRYDPTLQADLPPSRHAPGHDRELPAQARRRRQRQRHAHQRLGEQRRQEHLLGSDGEETSAPSAGSSSTASSPVGNDICLLLNASVNAYRRLDPHFEAPNQIKASAVDRGSMVRVPIGNERSARVEVRSVGPDANPYMVMLLGLQDRPRGRISERTRQPAPSRSLPARQHLRRARQLRSSEWTTTLFGADVKGRYADLKQASADRCPRLLGTFVKAQEVQYHHEVYNQYLWNLF
jgi:glutamine synthetase